MVEHAGSPVLPPAHSSGDVSTQELTQIHVSIPSPAILAAQYTVWLESIMPSVRERYQQAEAGLNIAALQNVASEAFGSACNKSYKISQGGYNQVFLLTFDNGREAVARVNMRDGGGGELPVAILRERVQSEAATLKWVRKNTSIPVPDVYACDPCPNNAVGGAYILEERVLGQRLDAVWDDLTHSQRIEIMEQISRFEGELFATRFPLIGSIYCDSTTGNFLVGRLGPSVVRIVHLGDDRGPWTSIRNFFKSYVDHERTWLAECREEFLAKRRQAFPDGDPYSDLSYFTSLYDILGRIIDRAEFLDKVDPSIASFVLFHEDIRTNNTLVAYDDPARVVAIVDWEGARILPMWSCFDDSQISVPFPEVITEEECKSLGKLRNDIMVEMVPGLADLDSEVGLIVRRLYYLISFRLSATDSVYTLNEYIQGGLSHQPLEDDAFAELREFVIAQNGDHKVHG